MIISYGINIIINKHIEIIPKNLIVEIIDFNSSDKYDDLTKNWTEGSLYIENIMPIVVNNKPNKVKNIDIKFESLFSKTLSLKLNLAMYEKIKIKI
ncbi:hypothetical protein GCL60_11820 [Silvanigrella paludirubra]|uniref:Uncharacterized protein n=1 Tax=Silvanigrella paludirubra TaxID=2499159 RepID=A0A6N6VVH6_9BACT|nr:hypothetical protein [Silvanigrella paludirubra]KAB8037855.1 hypothetical protein GCL60_11820 [Silvanigrella paludirubra]